ncbi:MAG: hypothetical protein WBE14_28545 [Xanthobacteraceae bacterium]|jgi:hypothetical protein
MNVHPSDLLSAEPDADKKICEKCGVEFSPRAGTGGKPQRFCSPQCRTALHAEVSPNVSQRSPTCGAETTLPAATQPTEKDEPAAAGEDFDWKDRNSIVLHEQPTTAIYFNPNGGLVIRQMASWCEEDDPVVVIAANRIPEFLDRLCDICGIPSFRGS